jgi:hypothetical protein
MGYHSMVLDGLRARADWLSPSPRGDYLTIHRRECEDAGVQFDDLVNGLRCEDSMVAVPRCDPVSLKGFARNSLGHQTADLYLKNANGSDTDSFEQRLGVTIRTRDEYFRPLIETCIAVTSLNAC